MKGVPEETHIELTSATSESNGVCNEKNCRGREQSASFATSAVALRGVLYFVRYRKEIKEKLMSKVSLVDSALAYDMTLNLVRPVQNNMQYPKQLSFQSGKITRII